MRNVVVVASGRVHNALCLSALWKLVTTWLVGTSKVVLSIAFDVTDEGQTTRSTTSTQNVVPKK